MKVEDIAHYAYFSMLSSDQEKNIKDIVANDLADIENKINEHTNSKLNKIIKEIEKKYDWSKNDYNLHLYEEGLDDTIEIIKREITKT